MKPITLEVQSRIREAHEKALQAIELAHEKEGVENFGFTTFGGPILNETGAMKRYDAMLAGTIGKTEPVARRVARKPDKADLMLQSMVGKQ